MALPNPQILVSESVGFSPHAARLLSELGQLTLADLDRQALLDSIGEVDVLWIRLRHQIDTAALEAACKLQFIVSPTTGLSHIDLEQAERRGVHVLSLRDETEFLRDVRATAEHTIGLMLALLRNIPEAVLHVRQNEWDRDQFRGTELNGKTIGIIGYGRLGRLVSRYLKGFDTRLLAADPHFESATADSEIELVSLPELLHASDIITLHANLSPGNFGFFGRTQFAAMKPGAWFVNTARGELVDESALLEALLSGRLAGAALDVLSGEQTVDRIQSPLLDYAREHANLIITPHLGGCTRESMEMTELFMAKKLRQYLQPDFLKVDDKQQLSVTNHS